MNWYEKSKICGRYRTINDTGKRRIFEFRDNPAPMSADAVTRDVELKLENSRIIAITRAKIEADSAIACPTSMVLNKSPAPWGLRDSASLAWAAV